MKKFLFLAVLMLAVVSFALAMPGQGGPGGNTCSAKGEPKEGMHMGGGMGFGGPGMVMKFIDELNLNTEQTKKIQDLKSASKKQAVVLKSGIELASVDIQDEMRKDSPDKLKIEASADKISAAGAKMLKMHLNDMLQIKKILTKKQFEKLTIMMEEDKKSREAKKEKTEK